MAVDVSAEVTRTFPDTESKLSDASDGVDDYAAHKARAISRAKRALYGSRTVPAEADIPEVAAYWIVDQAVVFLVPLAIDWYMNHSHVSSNEQGTTITQHNRVNALQQLRSELETSLAATKQAALEAIDTGVRGDDVPAVSFNGMAVDPLDRAMGRGPLL